MGASQPRLPYRKLEDGSATVNVSGPFDADRIDGRLGRVVARALCGYGRWRIARMSPEKLERSRREQQIAAARLPRDGASG